MSLTSRAASMRVLVVHDWMLAWAGAERALAEIMNVVPHADLVVGAVHPRLRAQYPVARRARESWLSRFPIAYKNHRWLMPLQYPAFANLDASNYDVVISSASAFTKAVRPRRGCAHLSYCYSPPRYLWDMGEVYRQQVNGASALALRASTPVLRMLDRRSARNVTHFIGISHFVSDRIKRVYGRESDTIYPPVESKPASRPAAREDFLLVLGRLVPYKRVDLAIRAAERLNIPLMVAGDGPERASLERLKGKTTTFLGEVDEATAGDLMERCRAFVFCAEEDFGIAPLEANAHGAPVVGYARGALLETMSDRTAVFFDRPEVDAVCDAIIAASNRSWDDAALRANAERFAPVHFRQQFAAVLERAIEEAAIAARR